MVCTRVRAMLSVVRTLIRNGRIFIAADMGTTAAMAGLTTRINSDRPTGLDSCVVTRMAISGTVDTIVVITVDTVRMVAGLSNF